MEKLKENQFIPDGKEVYFVECNK
jgi:hypothetical protein